MRETGGESDRCNRAVGLRFKEKSRTPTGACSRFHVMGQERDVVAMEDDGIQARFPHG